MDMQPMTTDIHQLTRGWKIFSISLRGDKLIDCTEDGHTNQYSNNDQDDIHDFVFPGQQPIFNLGTQALKDAIVDQFTIFSLKSYQISYSTNNVNSDIQNVESAKTDMALNMSSLRRFDCFIPTQPAKFFKR